jgi:WD40 repeat protein
MPFTVTDAYRFFGRDKERQIIIQNLKASRLTLLYGASGVGKTSVLRAGVTYTLRYLADQNMSEVGAPKFVVVYFNSWKEDPLIGLKKAIENAANPFATSEPLNVSSPEISLSQALRSASDYVHGTILLLLDQFEEYFLYHSMRGEAFDLQLAQAVKEPGLRSNFLISMREDMLAQLDRLKGKIPNILNNYLRLEHLDLESARAAIENPLAWYNAQIKDSDRQFTIEPSLIDTVLGQVVTGQVTLGDTGGGVVTSDASKSEDLRIEAPLLQLVMSRLWEEECRERSTILRLPTLIQMGGAKEIADRYLDKALEALSREQQEIAASIFYYLVTPSGLKIVQTVGDLAEMAHVSRENLLPVLEHLSTDSRVLRSVDALPGSTGDSRYQIFHDVLAPAVLAWRAKYVKAQDLKDAERRAHEQQLRAEKESRSVSRLRWISAGLIVFLVVSAVAIYYASRNWTIARRQAQLNFARELEASAIGNLQQDPQLSLLLALQSLSVLHGMQSDNPLPPKLRDTLSQSVQASRQVFILHHENPKAKIQDVAFSPNGASFITVADDGTAMIWDATAGKPLLSLARDNHNLYKVLFSPTGEYFAILDTEGIATIYSRSGGVVGTMPTDKGAVVIDLAFVPGSSAILATIYDPDTRLELWEIGDGALNRKSSSPLGREFGQQYSAVAISNDLRRFAFAGSSQTGIIFDRTSNKFISLLGHHGEIESLSFSSDGQRLATSSKDGTAKIWNASTGQMISNLKAHTNTVFRVSFDPADPARVATASADGTARIWDADTGKSLVTLAGHRNVVNSAVFSPDGQRVVTVSWDGSIILWNAVSMHSGPVSDVSFGGNRLVSGGQDGAIRIWDASAYPLRSLSKLNDKADQVESVAFTRDGSRFAASGINGYAKAFEPSGAPLFALSGLNEHLDVGSIRFSPKGDRIVTAHDDWTARIWDAASGELLHKIEGHKGSIYFALFSPDGKRVATASQDQTVRLWDDRGQPWPGAGPNQFVRKLQDQVGYLAFSPNGDLLAASTLGDTVVVFDLKSGKDFALIGHRTTVTGIAFNPDGKSIATSSLDRTVRIWDIASHTVTAVYTHPAGVQAVAFRADGKYLATGANDGAVRIFPLDDNELLAIARSHVKRRFSDDECRQFLHLDGCGSLK